MKKNMNYIGMFILISFFLLFYIITNFLLSKEDKKENIIENNTIKDETNNYQNEISIITNLYNDVRILYDVVNNKFKVDQDDIIMINNIPYKKITNFDMVMNNLFTNNGINKYISDLGNYFAYTDSGYYLAGNLVTYQTYYFRGDKTTISIISSNEYEINAIIYEKWTSNNKNTLATIKVVKENNKWLVDNINIIATE
ncbi:MAG: hypothetical protein IJZ79_05440 [Bacilli bacterium]|nr:hypothetical protein [Bacilli bacterium]